MSDLDQLLGQVGPPPPPSQVRSAVPCGVTTDVAGREWVCVAPVHDTGSQRSSQRDARGYTPRAERHWFVRRYPATDH